MGTGTVRLRKAQRKQVEMVTTAIDDLLPHDHFVRTVWSYIESLDLSALLKEVRAVEGAPGRDATDPKILLCLWVVGLSEGIGSARRLAELATRDVVYRWICGGVTVNRDMLAAFRVSSGQALDGLLSQTIAAFTHAGVLKLNAVAQDGMKVRASAGAASFRREQTLQQCLEAAREQVARLKDDVDHEGASSTRQHAARERAAEEKLAAVQRAMAEMPNAVAAKEAQKKKGRNNPGEARVSTTDSDARVMKMADGGYRPAFNPQFATDVGSGVIVGVHVTNEGTDTRAVEPMLVDILNRTGTLPAQFLADGGYVSDLNVEALTRAGIEFFAPVREPRSRAYDPHARQRGESEEVGDWRERMGTASAKQTYKARAPTAERVNAELRDMGLRQLAVRGLTKVTSAVLLSALAFNIGRLVSLLA